MKNLSKILIMLFVFTNTFFALAQDEAFEAPEETTLDRNYFQLSSRVGYDFPSYKNNTPYIDYKGGLDLGLSLDYYWNWFGLGADVDFITNSPESTYPTSNLYETDLTTAINEFSLSEEKVTRLFYGIGPNVQYRTSSGKFTAELNTRVGFATIKGGRTYLEGTSTSSGGSNVHPLNFHAGYKDSGVLTFKGQMRFTYFLNKNWGVNAGAYYMKHFDVQELNEDGISALYHPFDYVTENVEQPINALSGEALSRSEPCDCDISSIGVFAGLTYKFTKKNTVKEIANVCPVCQEDHLPHCCATCGCGVTITAKDKFSGEILPNTDVVLQDLNGNIIQSGMTNSYGVIVFNDVMEDDYVIKGKLYNVNLETASIQKDEFKLCKKEGNSIQKVILYGDENFILEGNVAECNEDDGLQTVDIGLKDKVNAGEKHTLSDAEGDFMFHLKQESTYALNGKKDGYYSNEVEVSTSSYSRNKTLFIDFEMCIDPCGKAIKLDNINFDLDKSDILPASIPDLERIVKLMKDNPNIQVEMSSHTDSQGSDAYNKKLSQRRADATVSYIANQGISKDRLIARGAGETELKNTKCANNVPCTDDEHRVNRRTEFKVICF
ncbi:OmpA family protein [Bizionia argentinensis JUB59]|uniref:OmpA family protein n=1 Tax=Bizionia argentinensis JUB59 TaxID=1046627 RepID=G2EBU1_9FLAO|nr:OmpA family protein [Bizionia argentinensis]EGV44089.1 OmpA family protein [Bizionia argentinensis JUB59]